MNTTRKLRLKKPGSNTPTPTTPVKKTPKKPEVPAPPKPYEIPGFPRSEGPTATKTPNGILGVEKGHHTVVLDTGTFWYVWQMVEERARLDHQKMSSSMPNVKRVTEETVRAFRDASGYKTHADGKRIPKLKLKGGKK